ncbi:MAG: hypothetical protein QNK37_38440 [Acidobacteriota bacterium]|nr:hypothetical protein [Acidobacteriota bacterium]
MAETKEKTKKPTDLSDYDKDRLLDSVNHYLQAGLDLQDWWKKAWADKDFSDSFRESVTMNRPDYSFGFFDKARVRGKDMKIMGNYQSMFYDQPKVVGTSKKKAVEWIRDQVREFALGYFMRISDFQKPRAYRPDHKEPPIWLRPFSLDSGADPSREGFGFRQIYFKLPNGKPTIFDKDKRYAVVDQRRLEDKYEWILFDVDIFDFSFDYKPLGSEAPEMVMPMQAGSYVVADKHFLTNEDAPEKGILGRYGVGYAFVKNPESSLLGYGPGEFEAAFEQIVFEVHDDGRIRVNMTFVSNQPERIVNMSLDPITWGERMTNMMTMGMSRRMFPFARDLAARSPLRAFKMDPVFMGLDMINGLTGGQAGKTLGLSPRELLKAFLLKHFQQHYETIKGSLQTWRQIPDWLADPADLPEWVRTGVSS